MCRSPSQSPVKKTLRSSGRFQHGPGAEAEPGAEAVATPDLATGSLSRCSCACRGCQVLRF